MARAPRSNRGFIAWIPPTSRQLHRIVDADLVEVTWRNFTLRKRWLSSPSEERVGELGDLFYQFPQPAEPTAGVIGL